MGISYSYLSILEKGIDPRTGKDSNPKPDTLRLISRAYDYPYEELMKAAGYLNDENTHDRKFDLTVFISNINLIMGNRSIEEFSDDIFEKTGFRINASQIRSYLDGDIEPYPGTINILSKFVRVTPDFWYSFNTEQTLKQERKKFENQGIDTSTDKFDKEYAMFTTIRDDIKNWVVKDVSQPYIKIAMEAQEKRVAPNALRMLVKTLISDHTDN
jgi:hypothetical protein